ncbi:asparagine synthase B [Halobacillus sp. BBL2006]|uniref:asparagine synthase B n=1 Tax=Halobacillus sp. BBL2006 TaxID=1543706 RepID=UPI000542B311|nr:asparagine synthase B [Halobacillus sp. BBL2006]KHE72566.1 asparagine synthase [Halobacillus sp. BBL2006]
MCGLFVSMGEITTKQMDAVLELLYHRGPDEGKSVVTDRVHLGHRRLSIIGLDDGIQPIHNQSQDKWIVCNGEIYNYERIKAKLELETKFITQSDSEVALKLIEKNGAEAIDQLDGMFAFFIADEKNDSFVVARDTLGIKPLYYGLDQSGNYVFSSELKALDNFVEKAEEFPHGHYFTPEEGFVCYRKITSPEKLYNQDQIEKVNENIRETMKSAVKKRLIADVEVGVLLSGGLDSSLIAAIAKKHHSGNFPLKSFCVGAEGSADVMNARKVAEALGTEHYEYIYTENELVEAVSDVIYHLESYEPSLVRSAIPNYFVSKLASEHVKVILSGEGADELFAGYAYMEKYQNTASLNQEIIRILNTLHNVNLQRADRMSMAHSLELRVPFLDLNVVENALQIPAELKIHKKDRMEKWLLRKAFDGELPDEVLWRKKAEFSEGSGALDILDDYAENVISDEEFNAIKEKASVDLRSKQEAFYYEIFKKHFPSEGMLQNVGKWATA